MKFTKGLIRDKNPIDLPSGAWSHAKNVVITKRSTLSNEPGIVLYGNHPSNLTPMGKYVLGLKQIIFSQDNVNPSMSEIGEIDQYGNYKTILRSVHLGFTLEHPVLKAEGQINYLGEEIVAWITRVHPPRILNITTLPFELDDNYELVDPLKINAINIFQQADVAIIDVISVNETGGSIPSGTVQFAIAYSNKGLFRTNIFNPTNPIPITPASMSNYDKIQGAEPGTGTSKSVTLDILQTDQRFDYVHLYVIRRVDGTLFVEEVTKLNNSAGNIRYTYTGAENVTDLTLEELLVDRVPYNSALAMTQVNDRLYLGNLTGTVTPNYQEHFLKLKIDYTTRNLTYGGQPPSGMKAPIVIHDFSGFFPGEVYAIYGSARLKDGTVTAAFHIPGRDAVNIATTTVSERAEINPDGTVVGGSLAYSLQEDYLAGARRYYQTRPTSNNVNAPTNMGFWENLSEVYPDGYGDLVGKNIRHHRFPESYEVNQSNNKSLQMDSIGIVVSGFDLFPQDVLDQIDSVELFYARKDLNNSLIIGQEITKFEHEQAPGGIKDEFYQYFGGNWDLQYIDDNGDTNDDWANNGSVSGLSRLDRNRLRFNNFDVMNSKPSISPSHVTFQYGLRGADLFQDYSDYARTGHKVDAGIAKGNISDPNARKTWFFGVLDYSAFDTTVITHSLSGSEYLKPVKSGKYVPANVTIGTEINKLGNEHYLIELAIAATLAINTPTFVVDYHNANISFSNNDTRREEVYLYNLCQVRTDVFKGLSSQTLVSMGVVIKAAELLAPYTLFGGDTIVSENASMDHVMVPTIRRDKNDSTYYMRDEYYRGEDAVYQGLKFARRFTGYFRGNPGYRHINEGIGNSVFYSSASNIDSLFDDYRRDQPEIILYNEDYSFKNELIAVFPFDSAKKETGKFPTRIIRSPLQGREVTDIQWNGFLPGDYFEHQKNRGEIINLENDNDRLFIHCRFGLFITRSSDTLKGNETNVEISSGDIFALPPREIITSDTGYAGLHSSFAAKKCKLGYVFADVDQGKVFIVSEGIDEISAYGLRNEFIDNLPFFFWKQTRTQVDHPYQQFGILVEFDERFNRVILVKKDLELVDPGLMGDVSQPPVTGSYYFQNGKLMKFNGIGYEDLGVGEYTDKRFTMSYYHGSPGIWLGYHDYSPDIFLSNRLGLYSYKNSRYHIHNSPVRKFYGVDYTSFVDFVFNEPNVLTKTLMSLRWQSEVINGNLSEQKSTLTSGIVYNSYQCSGEVMFHGENISYVENEWRFNQFMDVVIDRNLPFMVDREVVASNINQNMIYYKQRKFIDKYFVVRLYYNNSLSKDIYIYDVSLIARPSAQ